MSIYQTITDQIAAAVERGAGDFVMPWHRPRGTAMPYNPCRKGTYSGCNVLNLWIAAEAKALTTNYWATFKQWQELGAQVRKGERSTVVMFYKPLEVKDRNAAPDSDDKTTILMGKAYHVFNADQVDGWSAPVTERPIITNPAAPIPHIDLFVQNTGADIRTGEARAYYRPSADYINMPERELFTGSPTSTPTETYYSTLLHELTHWTGAKHRLDRDKMGSRFGDEQYAAEELVAELGAAFMCAHLGIANDPRPDHAQYIANWLTILKNDPRAIFTAASKAQAAADYLIGLRAQQTMQEAA